MAHRYQGPLRAFGKPRDVLLITHSPSIRDQIMDVTHNKPCMEYCGARLQLFADLPPMNLLRRSQLKPYTAALRNHEIHYRWGFPFILRVFFQNKTYTFADPVEAKTLLQSLNLLDNLPGYEEIPPERPRISAKVQREDTHRSTCDPRSPNRRSPSSPGSPATREETLKSCAREQASTT